MKATEKQRLRVNKWYVDNRSEVLEKRKVYGENNKEKRAAYAKEYYIKNKKVLQRYNKEYGVAHKAEKVASNANCRYKRCTPEWANPERMKDFYIINHTLRRIMPELNTHVDHIIPLNGKNVCGFHVESNLRIIEGKLNMEKGCRL